MALLGTHPILHVSRIRVNNIYIYIYIYIYNTHNNPRVAKTASEHWIGTTLTHD